ncbi:DNA-binding transcriptional regulator [bacterium]|nr:MAG: DNA-binding transcriptional regulator [bacterium]
MKKYRSEIAESVHQGMANLHALGIVDKTTMRELDESCLSPVEEFTPEALRDLRDREGASQAVLARHLYVTTATVSQWERGERRPAGAALKLLTLVKTHGLAYIR